MSRTHGRVRPAAATLSAVVLLAGGCTGEPAAPRPSPVPTPTTAPGTVARAEVGDLLTVTASVERVITDGAFVVRDVDLTDGALLVLSTGLTVPAAPQLVTVEGTVIRSPTATSPAATTRATGTVPGLRGRARPRRPGADRLVTIPYAPRRGAPSHRRAGRVRPTQPAPAVSNNPLTTAA
ncbi:hypothetical protein AB0B85_32970 [Micromonospora sp. NPDC049044]|uniref:hypothetical protein n=1 Tax=Micromonospora sp. NPDC049044 TaxID=3154827 RepID=UPI0033EB7A2E